MSDYNLDREIEEGLKRSEKMLRRQKTVRIFAVIFILLICFMAIGGASMIGFFKAHSVDTSPTIISNKTARPSTLTDVPTDTPTEVPTDIPTDTPTDVPTDEPTNTPIITQASTSSADCPWGDISGTWNGSIDSYSYTMVLKQIGCQVSGTSWTTQYDGTEGVARVKGSIDANGFYFTEYGEPGWCYFAGTLSVGVNNMSGADVACNSWVTLVRK